MKIFDHTIYAPTKIDRHDKTSALSAPSVVDTYQYSYRVNIYSGSESAWTLDKEVIFTYNGWNLIQEVEASVYDSNNSAFTQFRTSNYTWGLDLSQTIQGAGGVSGLLSLDKGTATYYYTYDANGNVSELIDTAGNIAAHYEYSPFGKVVHKSGPLADKNPFQFSTKYLDNETQLYYYGYRYYNPENGRWINRDPIEERGGKNVYNFLQNKALNYIDLLGLSEKTTNKGQKCVCGPNVTEWFRKELIKHRKLLEKLRKSVAPLGWIIFVRKNGLKIQYKNMKFESDNCPKHEKCKNTVWLAGKCIHRSELGNIVLGFWWSYLGFNRRTLIGGVNLIDSQNPGEGVNSPEDAGGVGLGFEFGLRMRPERGIPQTPTVFENEDSFIKGLEKGHSLSNDNLNKVFEPFRNADVWKKGWNKPWESMSEKYKKCSECKDVFDGKGHNWSVWGPPINK